MADYARVFFWRLAINFQQLSTRTGSIGSPPKVCSVLCACVSVCDAMHIWSRTVNIDSFLVYIYISHEGDPPL